jgi:hypothetical protein
MNERIRELAAQAGLEFDDDLVLESEPIYYTTQKDLEKFAELIVRECADFVAAGEFGDPGTAKMLMEDFGVEE